MKFRMCQVVATALLALLGAPAVHASTECGETLTRVFVGGDTSYSASTDILWLAFANGGAAVVQASDPNYKSMLALALTAQSLGKTVTVRYASDGVSCSAVNPGGVVGLWLNS